MIVLETDKLTGDRWAEGEMDTMVEVGNKERELEAFRAHKYSVEVEVPGLHGVMAKSRRPMS